MLSQRGLPRQVDKTVRVRKRREFQLSLTMQVNRTSSTSVRKKCSLSIGPTEFSQSGICKQRVEHLLFEIKRAFLRFNSILKRASVDLNVRIGLQVRRRNIYYRPQQRSLKTKNTME